MVDRERAGDRQSEKSERSKKKRHDGGKSKQIVNKADPGRNYKRDRIAESKISLELHYVFKKILHIDS